LHETTNFAAENVVLIMNTDASVSCLNILGGVLYLSPLDAGLTPVFNVFSDPNWMTGWPCGTYEELVKIDEIIQSMPHDPNDLVHAYTELFTGSDHMKAPPWGSVYLDRQHAAFGQSTLKLRNFLDEQGISLNRNKEEPEDHIGLLLLTAAWLGIAKREKALSMLLAEHILPWAPTYLNVLKTVSPHPFYQGIAELTLLTLKSLEQTRELDVTPLNLYQ